MGVAQKSFLITLGVFCYLPDKQVSFEQKSVLGWRSLRLLHREKFVSLFSVLLTT